MQDTLSGSVGEAALLHVCLCVCVCLWTLYEAFKQVTYKWGMKQVGESRRQQQVFGQAEVARMVACKTNLQMPNSAALHTHRTGSRGSAGNQPDARAGLEK